jgi:hypothetical protein
MKMKIIRWNENITKKATRIRASRTLGGTSFEKSLRGQQPHKCIMQYD